MWELPPEYLPDKYEDNFGNDYEFPTDKKEEMKKFALYFICVFGVFTVSLELYLYCIVKEWASKENLIQYAKAVRISSHRS